MSRKICRLIAFFLVFVLTLPSGWLIALAGPDDSAEIKIPLSLRDPVFEVSPQSLGLPQQTEIYQRLKEELMGENDITPREIVLVFQTPLSLKANQPLADYPADSPADRLSLAASDLSAESAAQLAALVQHPMNLLAYEYPDLAWPRFGESGTDCLITVRAEDSFAAIASGVTLRFAAHLAPLEPPDTHEFSVRTLSLETSPQPGVWVYGEALDTVSLTGGSVVDDLQALVDGEFVWDTPEARAHSASGSVEQTVRFVPYDTPEDATAFSLAIPYAPRPVWIEQVGALSKLYDGSLSFPTENLSVQLANILDDDAALLKGLVSAESTSPAAGTDATVSVTLVSLEGERASYYVIDSDRNPFAASGSIEPATISLSIPDVEERSGLESPYTLSLRDSILWPENVSPHEFTFSLPQDSVEDPSNLLADDNGIKVSLTDDLLSFTVRENAPTSNALLTFEASSPNYLTEPISLTVRNTAPVPMAGPNYGEIVFVQDFDKMSGKLIIRNVVGNDSSIEMVEVAFPDDTIASQAGRRNGSDYSFTVTQGGDYTVFIFDRKGRTVSVPFSVAMKRVTDITFPQAADGVLKLNRSVSPYSLGLSIDAENGAVAGEDYRIVWNSSAPEIASVDESGILTLHRTGSTEITVTAMEQRVVLQLLVAISTPANTSAQSDTPSVEVPAESFDGDLTALSLSVEGLADPQGLLSVYPNAADALNGCTGFFAYDISLLNPDLTSAALTGPVTVTLPYPPSTNSGHLFTVVHLKSNSSVEILPSRKTERGLSFETSSFSTFFVGYRSPPKIRDRDTDTSSRSSKSAKPDSIVALPTYWKSLLTKIKGASIGSTLQIRVNSDSEVPVAVLEALKDRNLLLIVEWEGRGALSIHSRNIGDLTQNTYSYAALSRLFDPPEELLEPSEPIPHGENENPPSGERNEPILPTYIPSVIVPDRPEAEPNTIPPIPERPSAPEPPPVPSQPETAVKATVPVVENTAMPPLGLPATIALFIGICTVLAGVLFWKIRKMF